MVTDISSITAVVGLESWLGCIDGRECPIQEQQPSVKGGVIEPCVARERGLLAALTQIAHKNDSATKLKWYYHVQILTS